MPNAARQKYGSLRGGACEEIQPDAQKNMCEAGISFNGWLTKLLGQTNLVL
jgi:hypothetical protein